MKKSAIFAIVALSMTSTWASAANLNVRWHKPDQYRDIAAADQHRGAFRREVFATLTRHFEQLAGQLPPGQTLNIKVTDLDLAGRVHFGARHQVRVIRETDMPRISFSYTLQAANDRLIRAGEVQLKDSRFASRHHSYQRLGYERRMIDQWFVTTFNSKTI